MDGKTLTTASLVMLVLALGAGAASLGGAERIPWSKFDDESSTEVNYALKEFVTKASGSQNTVAWDDDLCSSDPCKDCQESGDAALSFVVFGLVANAATLALAYTRYKNGTTKFFVWVAAFVAAACYGVAWSTWLGGCHDKLNDAVEDLGGDEEDLQPDIGFALSFSACVLTGLSGLSVMISGDWS